MVRSPLKGHGLGWMLMRRVIDYAQQKGLRLVRGRTGRKRDHAANVRRTGLRPGSIEAGAKRVVLDLKKIEVRWNIIPDD